MHFDDKLKKTLTKMYLQWSKPCRDWKETNWYIKKSSCI